MMVIYRTGKKARSSLCSSKAVRPKGHSIGHRQRQANPTRSFYE
jgi:hypothetical protein